MEERVYSPLSSSSFELKSPKPKRRSIISIPLSVPSLPLNRRTAATGGGQWTVTPPRSRSATPTPASYARPSSPSFENIISSERDYTGGIGRPKTPLAAFGSMMSAMTPSFKRTPLHNHTHTHTIHTTDRPLHHQHSISKESDSSSSSESEYKPSSSLGHGHGYTSHPLTFSPKHKPSPVTATPAPTSHSNANTNTPSPKSRAQMLQSSKKLERVLGVTVAPSLLTHTSTQGQEGSFTAPSSFEGSPLSAGGMRMKRKGSKKVRRPLSAGDGMSMGVNTSFTFGSSTGGASPISSPVGGGGKVKRRASKGHQSTSTSMRVMGMSIGRRASVPSLAALLSLGPSSSLGPSPLNATKEDRDREEGRRSFSERIGLGTKSVPSSPSPLRHTQDQDHDETQTSLPRVSFHPAPPLPPLPSSHPSVPTTTSDTLAPPRSPGMRSSFGSGGGSERHRRAYSTSSISSSSTGTNSTVHPPSPSPHHLRQSSYSSSRSHSRSLDYSTDSQGKRYSGASGGSAGTMGTVNSARDARILRARVAKLYHQFGEVVPVELILPLSSASASSKASGHASSAPPLLSEESKDLRMREIRPGVTNPSMRPSAPSIDAYPPSIRSSSSDDDGGSFKSCVVEPPSLPSSTASTASPSSNASTAGDVLLIDFESDRSRGVPIAVRGGDEGRSSVRDSRMTLGSDLDPFSSINSINSIASLSLRMSTLSTVDTEGTGIGEGGMRISGTSFLDTIKDSVRSTSTRGSDREGDGEGEEIDLEQVFEASILPSSPPRLSFTTSNDPHDPPPSTAPNYLLSSHTQSSTTSTNQYLYSSPRSPQKLPSRRTIPTEWRAHSIDVPKSVYDPSTPGLEGFNEGEEGVVVREGSVGRGGVKLSLDIGVELEDVAARDVPILSRGEGNESAVLDGDGEGEWIDVGQNLSVRDGRSVNGKGMGRGSSIRSGRSGRSVRSGRSGRSGRVSTKSYSVDLSMLASSPGFAPHSPSDIATAGHSHHRDHARTKGKKLGGVVFEYDDGGLKRSRSLWDAGSSRRSMISEGEGEGGEESEDEKEMERMRNVWRARKMTKVFGSEPPAALYKVSLKSPSQTKYSYPSRKSSLGKAAAAGAGTGLKAVKTHSTPSSPRKSSAAKAREPRPTHPYAYAHNYAYATPSSAEADESITPPASPSTAGSHNRRMDGIPIVSPVTPDDDNEYSNITPASTTFEDSVLVISSSDHSDHHPPAESILSIEGTDGLSVPLPAGNGAKGADTLSLLSFASVSVSSFSTITTQVVPSQPSPHELRRLRAKKLSNFFGVDTPHLPPPSPLPVPLAPSAAPPNVDSTINSPVKGMATRPSVDTMTPISDATGRQSRKLQKSTTRSSTDRPSTPGRSRSRADSRTATASDEGHGQPRSSESRTRTPGRPRAGTKSRVFVEAGWGVVVDQEDEMGMQEVMAVLRRLR